VATELKPDVDAEYRQIREECGLLVRERASIEVTGPEAGEYLQGQVTNDAEGLPEGGGCYALLLDRKGHIQVDMRLLRPDAGRYLIDTSPSAGPGLLKHLDTYRIGRQVEVGSSTISAVSLLGPGTVAVTGLAPGGEFSSVPTTVAGVDCLAVATDTGVDFLCAPEQAAAVRDQLVADGAVPVSEAAVEILRVESGRPALEKEMAAGPMPAEAGVVERAIDFTKGCYIGQEPVARLHYRGRPNRHLRGMRLDGPVSDGDVVRLGERELGHVGTAVVSPASGRIALAILRKEAGPGETVSIDAAEGETSGTVVELPFPAGAET
jgi:folate-binding protein YgfZ